MTPGDTDTERENSRLITLMLQVATIDGKLDGALNDLSRRVKALEDRNNGSTPRALGIVAAVTTALGVLLVVGDKLTW